MSTTLNKDVLKRTDGLLASIDAALSITTNAERVDRLLSSAAPSLEHPLWNSVDEWDHYYEQLGATNGEVGYADYGGIDNEDCGCERVEATLVYLCCGDSGWEWATRKINTLDCHTDKNGYYIDEDAKDEPISLAPWQRGHHAADAPCGAKGCKCVDVFLNHTCCHCGCPVSVEHDGPGEYIILDATQGDGCDESPDGVHDVEG